MSLSDQSFEDLVRRKLNAINRLQRLEAQIIDERNLVDWLVEEIDEEIAKREIGKEVTPQKT